MFNRGSPLHKVQDGYTRIVYDNSAVKIVFIAIMLMVLSISFLSCYSYWIVKNAIVHKLKTQDLLYIVKSISSKVDARIIRAKETSLILAEDPFVQKWLQDGEKDETLGRMNKQKITAIAKNCDYQKVFIVSAITGHYWTQNGILLDTVNKTDPDDSWFFETLNCHDRVTVQIDYNNEYRDTFVFINVLIGDVNKKPLGIAGVGLNLNSISREFKSYKFGQKSNMWLVDQDGRIHITEDIDHLNRNLVNYIPPNIVREVLGVNRAQHIIVEYKRQNGEKYDLIAQPIAATDWKLVFQIPRSESIQVVQAIKNSTIFACIIIMVLITVIFYFISEKIANPYKRAVQLGKELEKVVDERTQELSEKTLELQDRNTKIMDSIEYAKIIQESILPTPSELRKIFADYFIIWKPCDMVGGDFYWMKKLIHGYVIAVGDCTGHGVPGALMTMAANSILNYIVNETNCQNPALILKSFNRAFKATINKKDSLKIVNEGLDLGICYFDQDKLIYAGAKTALYIKGLQGLKVISGDGKGVGYKHVDDDYDFRNTTHYFHEEDTFIITTDGYLSQNGGEKNFSFGRKKFEQMIKNCDLSDLAQAKQVIEAELLQYMNVESQRDDITVIGFKIKPYKTLADNNSEIDSQGD
jgi:serine phosphatase RsbU (regulator of sigma subunit)